MRLDSFANLRNYKAASTNALVMHRADSETELSQYKAMSVQLLLQTERSALSTSVSARLLEFYAYLRV